MNDSYELIEIKSLLQECAGDVASFVLEKSSIIGSDVRLLFKIPEDLTVISCVEPYLDLLSERPGSRLVSYIKLEQQEDDYFPPIPSHISPIGSDKFSRYMDLLSFKESFHCVVKKSLRFLILTPHECAELKENKVVSVSIFSSGASLARQNVKLLIEDPNPFPEDNKAKKYNWKFILVKDKPNKITTRPILESIDVEFENLSVYIKSGLLDKFRMSLWKKQLPFYHENCSDEVKIIRWAYDQFWSDTNPKQTFWKQIPGNLKNKAINKDKYVFLDDLTTNIRKSLSGKSRTLKSPNGKLNNGHVELALNIIRPDYAVESSDGLHADIVPQKLIRFLAASHFFWAEKSAEDKSKHPELRDIVNELMTPNKLLDYPGVTSEENIFSETAATDANVLLKPSWGKGKRKNACKI